MSELPTTGAAKAKRLHKPIILSETIKLAPVKCSTRPNINADQLREILQGSLIVRLQNSSSDSLAAPGWRFVDSPSEIIPPAAPAESAPASLPLEQDVEVVSIVADTSASGSADVICNNEMLVVAESATEGSSAKKRKYSDLKAAAAAVEQADELDETSAMRIRILDKYERLINDPEFSDVRIIVEGKSLHAHKAILARSSSKFRDIFRNIDVIAGDKKEPSKVEIEDVKYHVFTEMLRFVYVGRVFNIENIVGELLDAADEYCLDDLKLVCEKYLDDNLIVENALEIVKIAQTYRLDRLQDKTIKFIASHADSFVDDPGFKALSDHVLYEVCRAMVKNKK